MDLVRSPAWYADKTLVTEACWGDLDYEPRCFIHFGPLLILSLTPTKRD